MTKKTNSNRPTQRVYAVIKKNGEDKGTWVEIGAVWPHKDGKGSSVKLNLIPVSDATEIVIRDIKANADASEGGAA